jgi:hypothetical protein
LTIAVDAVDPSAAHVTLYVVCVVIAGVVIVVVATLQALAEMAWFTPGPTTVHGPLRPVPPTESVVVLPEVTRAGFAMIETDGLVQPVGGDATHFAGFVPSTVFPHESTQVLFGATLHVLAAQSLGVQLGGNGQLGYGPAEPLEQVVGHDGYGPTEPFEQVVGHDGYEPTEPLVHVVGQDG